MKRSIPAPASRNRRSALRLSFRDRRESGYTLFEIMLVLSIIAILVGSAIYSLVGNLDSARDQRVTADVQTISTQLRTYEMANYSMPTTDQGLDALVSPPGGDPKPRRWRKLLETVPLDPWGTPYIYRNPSKNGNSKGYDLFSAGPDKKESDDDIGR